MRMTTKGRFAVTAMIDLALREQRGAVTLAAISQRQQISLSYLEQLFSRLRRSGLVESTRGPGGGYTLGRKAEDISVADIILAVDQGEDEAPAPGQRVRDQSLTRDLWERLSTNMIDYMQSISLRELVLEQLAKGVRIEEPQPARRTLVGQRMPAAPQMPSIHAPNSVFALGKTLRLAR